MTPDQLDKVLYTLHDAGRIVLPYGCAPIVKGNVGAVRWRKIGWNPAERQQGFEVPDPRASAKPAFSFLEAELALLECDPEELRYDLGLACEAAITAAYGARDRQHETQRRLAGQSTAAQDAERVRLIARCHAVEAQIEGARTIAQRKAILARIKSGSWSAEPKPKAAAA